MSVRYDDRDLATLLVVRGVLTAEAIERALRAASDPSPGRLVTTLLQQRVLDTPVLEQALAELCSNQFRCRACQTRFVALPLDKERKVACPSCGKWNLIPPAEPPSAARTHAQPPPSRAEAPPRPRRTPTGTVIARPSTGGPRPAPLGPERGRPSGPAPGPALEATRKLDQAATEPLARAELADAALPASRSSRMEVTALKAPLVPGQRFGPYTIVGELARGAMGVLYTARHEKVKNRIVALKVLQGDLAEDKEQVERFKREAQALARVEHPAVVRVHDAGQIDGQPFFTMELVEGQNLEDRIRAAPLEPLLAARIMAEVARGCAYLHTRGVIHRDLKLSNVLVDPEGRPRIADFGLARLLDRNTRLTLEGDMLGTPLYMAPEQIRGELDVDPRTDVYALGVMLFRLVTKEYPFSAPAPTALYAKVLTEPPAWPKDRAVPDSLRQVVERCLQKERVYRYPDATTLALDLDAFERGADVKVQRPGLGQRARDALSLRRSARVLMLLMAASMALLVAAVGVRVARVVAAGSRAKRLHDATARATRAKETLASATTTALRKGGDDATKARDVRAARELARAALGEPVPPAPGGQPLDPDEQAYARATAAVTCEGARAEAAIARLLARPVVEPAPTPVDHDRLEKLVEEARSALAKVELPSDDELRSAGEDPAAWRSDRAYLEEARFQVLVLSGSPHAAYLAACRAFQAEPEREAAAEARAARAVACARLALLDGDDLAAVSSWQRAATFPASGAELARGTPFGEDARTRDELATVAEVRAGTFDPEAPLPEPGERGHRFDQRRVAVAAATLERERAKLESAADPDGAPLDAVRKVLVGVSRVPASAEDAASARIALGELELACARPADAASVFELALTIGRKDAEKERDKDLPHDRIALARTPVVCSLMPGVVVTAPARTAAVLGLARARAELFDDEPALRSAEAAVAAVGSGAPSCAAELLVARARRIRGDLDLAREAETRAAAALEGLPAGDLVVRMREAVAASRARTALAAGFGDDGLAVGAIATAVDLLRGNELVSEDARKLLSAVEVLRSGSAPVHDPKLEDLVARSRAELAAGLGLRDSVEADSPAFLPRQKAHFARSLRAASLARERDPASTDALAALARAWLACEKPAPRAVAFADRAVSASFQTPAAAEPLIARGLARLAVAQDASATQDAAADFKAAEERIRSRNLPELEAADYLIRVHRMAARALARANAAGLALVERKAAADLADATGVSPEVRVRLHGDCKAAAQSTGDATLEATEDGLLERAKKDREALQEIFVACRAWQVQFDAGRMRSEHAVLDESLKATMRKAWDLARSDAFVISFGALFFGRSTMGLAVGGFAGGWTAGELDPEGANWGIYERRDGVETKRVAATGRYEAFADPDVRPYLERDSAPRELVPFAIRGDVDVRAAGAFALGLGQEVPLDARLGLVAARRLVRRRPELRTAHLLLGRLETFCDDGTTAVDELMLALDLPRVFEEAAPPVTADGQPARPKRTVAEQLLDRDREQAALYLLAEAQARRRDAAGAKDALRRAIAHRFVMIERVKEKFSFLDPRDLDALVKAMEKTQAGQ